MRGASKTRSFLRSPTTCLKALRSWWIRRSRPPHGAPPGRSRAPCSNAGHRGLPGRPAAAPCLSHCDAACTLPPTCSRSCCAPSCAAAVPCGCCALYARGGCTRPVAAVRSRARRLHPTCGCCALPRAAAAPDRCANAAVALLILAENYLRPSSLSRVSFRPLCLGQRHHFTRVLAYSSHALTY